MKIDRAKIHVFDENDKQTQKLEVMFNPTEYSNSLNAKWIGETSSIEFIKANYSNFTITLFFDSYEEQADVREDHEKWDGTIVRTVIGTKRIFELAVPTVPGKNRKQPPVCMFIWGKFYFKGVVEKVDQKFTMFLSTGIPVRAYVTVTLKNVLSLKDSLKLNGIGACRKARIVKDGDRLDIIASEELKDPAKWYLIANVNNIVDPLNFPTSADMGRLLIIPDVG